jgi:hypothetical protein
MRIVDKICAALLTLLGVVHCSFTFAFAHKGNGATNAALFLGAGIAIIIAGMMNGVRLARAADALLRNVSLAANILLAVFCFAMIHAVGSGISKAPQVVVVTAFVVIELIFSAVPRK